MPFINDRMLLIRRIKHGCGYHRAQTRWVSKTRRALGLGPQGSTRSSTKLARPIATRHVTHRNFPSFAFRKEKGPGSQSLQAVWIQATTRCAGREKRGVGASPAHVAAEFQVDLSRRDMGCVAGDVTVNASHCNHHPFSPFIHSIGTGMGRICRKVRQ